MSMWVTKSTTGEMVVLAWYKMMFKERISHYQEDPFVLVAGAQLKSEIEALTTFVHTISCVWYRKTYPSVKIFGKCN